MLCRLQGDSYSQLNQPGALLRKEVPPVRNRQRGAVYHAFLRRLGDGFLLKASASIYGQYR
jgi:hypothetical protein